MADGYIPLTVEALKTPEGISELNRMLSRLHDIAAGDGETVKVYSDYGSPEGAIVAGVGSVYLRKDGGASTSIYVKESGTSSTGWIAK